MFEKFGNKIEQKVKLGTMITLSALLSACNNTPPSSEKLKELLDKNRTLEKIDSADTQQINDLINFAKENKKTILFQEVNDTMKRSVIVDTVENGIHYNTEFKTDNIAPGAHNLLNRYYVVNNEEGYFHYGQSRANNEPMSRFSAFYGDNKTGVITYATSDIGLVPNKPNEDGGLKEYRIHKDTSIEGDTIMAKNLHNSYIQGLVEIKGLKIQK
ncbi:MAG: hypothetical protein Q8M15_16870 [Bacteroidota bacterium]|nr:hypothetical protein [Bacteroidota bacterium]